MRRIIQSCLVLVLGLALLSISTGCSRKRDPSQPRPPSAFEEEMNGYVGGPASGLFARLGVYDGMMPLEDGKTLYEWTKVDYGITMWRWVRYSKCEVRAVVNAESIVESWNSNGACK